MVTGQLLDDRCSVSLEDDEVANKVEEPILGEDTTPLSEYQPGTWGPPEAARIAADIGGWHDPDGPGKASGLK